MARREAIAAAAALTFGAGAAWESAKLPFGTFRNPGPGFFPWWASLTVGLLALVLLGQALTSRAGAAAAGSGEREGPGEGRGRLAKVCGLLAVLGAYVVLLEPLGYPLCTFLLVLFMLRATEPHRWAVALGMAAITAAGSYVVFAVWLKVPLPPGVLQR